MDPQSLKAEEPPEPQSRGAATRNRLELGVEQVYH